MTTTLMILQAIVSVLLIAMVLLQFGKGAEAGLMGGASDSVFTGAQRGNILGKITVVLSIIFLSNSVLLAKLQGQRSESSLMETAAPLGSPVPTPTTPQAPKDK